MAFNNAVNAATSGMQAITTAGVWNGRTITAGSGISVTNGDGIAGNPTIAATGAPLSTQWTFIDSKTTNGAVSYAFTTGITPYGELLIIFQGVNNSVSGDTCLLEVSTNGGGSYVNSFITSKIGTPTAEDFIRISQGAFTGVTGWVHFINNVSGQTINKCVHGFVVGSNVADHTFSYTASAIAQIDAIQVRESLGNNFNGGTVLLYGR